MGCVMVYQLGELVGVGFGSKHPVGEQQQGDVIVQHLWGGCSGVCYGLAVGGVGWE